MAIPRIIHQTWKSRELPPTLSRFAARWQELNPTYEYRLWTDADNDAFVEREFPRYCALYRSFSRGIFRADLARCLYLWRFGGVYVDLDIEPLRPLDDFLAAHGDCVLGAEPVAHAQKRRGKPQLACNAFMASRPGHPFWQRMVEEIERRAAVGGEPVGVTGPIALDAAHERWGEALGVAVSEPDAFFPLPDLDAQSLPIDERAREHFRRMRALSLYPQATFGVHHWAHTWIPEAPLNRAVQRLLETSRRARAVLRGERTVDEVLRPERYELLFPERAFPPRRSRAARYRDTVAQGREVAARSTLTILTLLRDRLDLALMLRARCEALLSEFREGQVVVLGADSRDGTERVLAEWTAGRKGVVHGAAAPDLPAELRGFSRMARLRNALLEHAERLPPTDFVAVLDGDLEGPVSLDGVRHASSLLADARGPDAVAALGVNNWVGLPVQLPFVGYGYYDPIAFRERTWVRGASDAAIRCRLAGLRRGDEPIAVKSAFAGLALYRGASVRGLRYDEDSDDCEHVGFHRALSERGGRLVLDPSLMLLSGRQGHHRTKRP